MNNNKINNDKKKVNKKLQCKINSKLTVRKKR